jgi:hypothetical protein
MEFHLSPTECRLTPLAILFCRPFPLLETEWSAAAALDTDPSSDILPRFVFAFVRLQCPLSLFNIVLLSLQCFHTPITLPAVQTADCLHVSPCPP